MKNKVKKASKSLIFKTGLIALVIITVFFIIVMFTALNISSGFLKKQLMGTLTSTSEAIEANISGNISKIINIMYLLSQEEELFSDNIDSVQTVIKKYKDTYFSDISSIIIIKNGQLLTISNTYLMSIYDVDVSFYVQNTKERELNMSSAYRSSLVGDNAVGFTKKIINEKDDEIILVIEASFSILSNTLSETTSAITDNFLILEKDEPIYFSGDDKSRFGLISKNSILFPPDDFVEILYKAEDGVSELKYKNADYILSKRIIRGTKWYIALLTDGDYFDSTTNELKGIYLKMSLFFSIFLIEIIVVLSFSVTHPVIRLSKKVDKIEWSKMEKIDDSKSSTEIKTLINSFNNLISRLKGTMKEYTQSEIERHKLEYKVLQSQIKPHFLLNVLICISSLIKIKKYDLAFSMNNELVMLLRMSIDKTSEFISLKDEMTATQAYINLQKLRFGEMFEFIIHDYEKFSDIMVPKLIIQPIVENSVYHGVMDIDWKGLIQIDFMLIDNTLHIIIEDNGKGMDQDIINSLSEHKAIDTTNRGMVSIGLANVNDRLKMTYGQDYCLHIFSRVSLGTRVELLIPVDAEKSSS